MEVCEWKGYGFGLVARNYNNLNYNNRQNVNANNQPSNRFEMTSSCLGLHDFMKTYRNIFQKLCIYDNLLKAFQKAKKRKSKKPYVIDFEKNLENNLFQLQWEILTHTYKPRPLTIFTVRDPKTRRISASNFRDRVVHHAVCNIIEPIFESRFIHDTYANRKKKGTLAALKRFDFFLKKVTGNAQPAYAFCKACFREGENMRLIPCADPLILLNPPDSIRYALLVPVHFKPAHANPPRGGCLSGFVPN